MYITYLFAFLSGRRTIAFIFMCLQKLRAAWHSDGEIQSENQNLGPYPGNVIYCLEFFQKKNYYDITMTGLSGM